MQLRRRLAVLMCSVGLMSLTEGCARETKIYNDQPAAVAETEADADSTVTIIDGYGKLPRGLFDLSVNHAGVELALDGTSNTSVAMRLVTWPIASAGAGAYNGPGTGNRAMLGLAEYAAKALSEVVPISFDSKSFGGTAGVDLAIVIDLDCDGGPSHTLIATAATLAPGVSLTASYTRYETTASDSRWRVMGPAIMDPGSPSVTLIPTTTDPGTASLNDLVAKFPKACLTNTVSTADEMPIGQTLTGIILSLGDATTSGFNGAFVNRISVGTKVHNASDWGTPL